MNGIGELPLMPRGRLALFDNALLYVCVARRGSRVGTTRDRGGDATIAIEALWTGCGSWTVLDLAEA